jgi:hypothetical protein
MPTAYWAGASKVMECARGHSPQFYDVVPSSQSRRGPRVLGSAGAPPPAKGCAQDLSGREEGSPSPKVLREIGK